MKEKEKNKRKDKSKNKSASASRIYRVGSMGTHASGLLYAVHVSWEPESSTEGAENHLAPPGGLAFDRSPLHLQPYPSFHWGQHCVCEICPRSYQGWSFTVIGTQHSELMLQSLLLYL